MLAPCGRTLRRWAGWQIGVALCVSMVIAALLSAPAPLRAGAPVAVTVPAPPPPPAAPLGQDTLELTGIWKLRADWEERGTIDGWQRPEFDDTTWRDVMVPGNWEDQGVTAANPRWPGGRPYNGYAWYRRHFQVPADWAQTKAVLHIGAIDDIDWTYINGQLVGSMTGERSFEKEREYEVRVGVLKPGADNVIAIRVLDMSGVGGIVNKPVELERVVEEPAAPSSGEAAAPGEEDLDALYPVKRGDQVQIFGRVKVEPNVRVEGDAVAVGGPVEVLGYVTGDVVSVGGSVYLRPGSRVDGNVTAVGGSVRRDEDATIKGSIIQVTIFPWAMPGLGIFAWPFSIGSYSPLGDFLRRLITWGVLGAILGLLLPKRLEMMARSLPLYPGWTAAHGVIGAIMTPAVVLLFALVASAICVVLAVTIIGIALIPAVLLGLVAALIGIVLVLCLGLGGVWLGLGQVITMHFSESSRGILPSVLIGVLVTAAASVIPVVGVLVVITLSVFAYGVALMTGVGTRSDWTHRRLRIHPAAEAGPTTDTPAA